MVVAGGNGNGSSLNQLPGPIGCYVDATGNLFVVDAINCWILEFPPNSTGSSYGTIVAGGNGVRGGTLPNSLLDPTSLFLDNAGNIYVSDDGNNRVDEYYKNGPRTSFIDTSYVLASPGPTIPCNFYAVVTNSEGCTDTTNTVTILPDNLPSISINSNAPDPNLCGQFTEPLTFTASIANGGSTPAYQWHLNGNVVGTNTPSYSGTFSNGDVVYCILTSNVSCVTIPSIASSDFIVHFHTPPFATLSLAGGDCPGKDSLIVNADIHSSSTLNWMIGGFTDTVYKSFQVLDTGIASIGITVAGGNGAGNAFNQLYQPSAICLDPSGNLYVADTRNNRVLFFQKGSNGLTNGVVVAGGHGDGFNPDQLSSPTSVWVDPNGYLYVADADNYRIQRFDPGSTSASSGFTVAGGNGPGAANNQFENPNTVCLDGAGNIYVCDELNNRIMEFPPNSNSQTNGAIVATVTDPFGMFVTPSGSIYVSDLQDHEVLLFPPANGTVVVSGVQGPSGSPLTPYGLFVDNQGDLFVADGANDQVLEYTKSFPNGIVVAGAKGKGSAANQLNEPYSICVDDSSNLYIADFGNNRVQKYKHFISIVDTVFYPQKEGVYSVTLTDTSGCIYTTNQVTISKPFVPTVQIAASKTIICYGDTVDFVATASDTSKSPNYLWKLNTDSVGTNSYVFSTDSLRSGDSVFCIISNSDGCAASDTSNTLSFTVKPIPQMGPATGATIPFGNSITLNIPVLGDVSSYSWSPDYFLSADNIQSPVATPRRSTTYYLTVVSSTNGCPATDSVTIEVTSKIHIPNAFTPNNDGINDVFYIMGGMPGDIIKDFSIFDRWGARVFQIQNGIPNYTNYGWDGTDKGKGAPTGTYVYLVTIKSTSGEEQVFKGTLVLIR